MGCICGKSSAIEDSSRRPKRDPPPVETQAKEVIEFTRGREVVAVVEKKQYSGPIRYNYGGEVERRSYLQQQQQQQRKQFSGPIRVASSGGLERKYQQQQQQQVQLRSLGSVGKAREVEQVAAGWPDWLAAVAGEAIRGWVPRRADSFEKLDKIGQGTYSSVYRARDHINGKIVALKKVRFDNLEPDSVRFMAREIHILRRLDHPNIVKLEGLITSRMSCSLYLIFEYMDHDLTGLSSSPDLKFTEPQIKCYMHQLLSGLDHCHSRGVLHRDIKGSNLLINNSGILKIADFGLASFYDPSQDHPLTSRVVTLWYRPPELLLGATSYGVAVDLWSSGCILAELYRGKPIMPGRTEVEQMHKIFKLCGSPSDDYWGKSKLPHATIFKPQHPYRRCLLETFKDFPAPALELLDTLLSVDPTARGTAASALQSEFFTTKPLACDPSSLPKYPPSKELDAKLRDEEARQGAGGVKVQKPDPERIAHNESRAAAAPVANAELAVSIQKWQGRANSRSRSQKFDADQDVISAFPMEPQRRAPIREIKEHNYDRRNFHSGPLVNQSELTNARKNDNSAQNISNVSTTSGSVVVHRNLLSSADGSRKLDGQSEAGASSGWLSESGDVPTIFRKYEQLYPMHGLVDSHQQGDERRGNMDKLPLGYGPIGNKIQYSGPLLQPSTNVDQMLKDHDRHIQEVSRRSRLDKSKLRKVQGEGYHNVSKPLDLGVVAIYPSSKGSAPVFTSNRGSMQHSQTDS